MITQNPSFVNNHPEDTYNWFHNHNPKKKTHYRKSPTWAIFLLYNYNHIPKYIHTYKIIHGFHDQKIFPGKFNHSKLYPSKRNSVYCFKVHIPKKLKNKTIFMERQKQFDFLKLNCVDTSKWCIHSTSRACKIGEMRSWSWVLRIASVEAAKSHKMKIRY